MDLENFRQILCQPTLDLLHAGLTFARTIAYPDLDIAAYMRRVDKLAEEARGKIAFGASRPGIAETVADHLFLAYKLRGNTTYYSDPRNSYLNEVLDRKLGLPIALAVIYIAVGQKLDLPVYGVGMPGHYIVGLDNFGHQLYLDPFNEGVWLSEDDCLRLVTRTTGYKGDFRPEWLRPTKPRDTLARMLNNLRIGYVERQQWPLALAAIEHLRLVQPDAAEHLRDKGLIHYRQGEFMFAAQCLNAYLTQVPDAADASTIKRGIAAKLSEWGQLN